MSDFDVFFWLFALCFRMMPEATHERLYVHVEVLELCRNSSFAHPTTVDRTDAIFSISICTVSLD